MQDKRNDAISESDLAEFLEARSDFAFELKVLRSLRDQGLSCEHGWSYDDPITGKPRQFDLRAWKHEPPVSFHFSLECKNVRPNSPLLIHTVPRSETEAFHEIVFSFKPPGNVSFPNGFPHVLVDRVNGRESLYSPQSPVGKSAVQVSRDSHGEFKATDRDFYDKWAQALNSADDLFRKAAHHVSLVAYQDECYSLVVPVLVVPDETLWQVDYDLDGRRLAVPHRADRCSYFVNRKYMNACRPRSEEMTVSHIEFVTFRGIGSLLSSLMKLDFGRAFPAQMFARLARSRSALVQGG